MICAAIITAGGIGSRMGSDRPKQYLDVAGLPILARSIAVFDKHPLVDYIVVTVPETDQNYCQTNVVDKYRFSKVKQVVKGGPSRQASVLNGLELCKDSDFVAIHDGVRPFISESVISEAIRGAEKIGACIAALPVTETVKKKRDTFLETIPRENLWLARTPQVFQSRLILKAHQLALHKHVEATDDAALVELMGADVGIVEDTIYNIKITSRLDLVMANMIAQLPQFID